MIVFLDLPEEDHSKFLRSPKRTSIETTRVFAPKPLATTGLVVQCEPMPAVIAA